MTTHDLVCLLFPDVWAHEREGVKTLLDSLSQQIRVECVDSQNQLNYFSGTDPNSVGAYWIVARDWQKALATLPLKHTRRPVFASVLTVATRRSFPDILRQGFRPLVPRGVQILTHSPINFRFFREIARISPGRVQYLPFPIGPLPELLSRPEKPEYVKIGSFVDFRSESNLHYLLNVAHCVKKRSAEQETPAAKFVLFGTGPLRDHLISAAAELGLTDSFEMRETPWLASIRELDVYFHTALQTGHYVPLCAAGQAGIPVVSSDVPGVEGFVVHKETGYLAPVNETEPIADALLDLIRDATLRRAMGLKFRQHIQSVMSQENLAESYRSLFVRGRVIKKTDEWAAATKVG